MNKSSRYALGRMKIGRMNGMETLYDAHLTTLKAAGEIQWFAFEGMKFRLADLTFYTPDFAVMLATGKMQFHEVKGFWEDDARVKIKVAAELFPFQFIGITAKTKKLGGGWALEGF